MNLLSRLESIEDALLDQFRRDEGRLGSYIEFMRGADYLLGLDSDPRLP